MGSDAYYIANNATHKINPPKPFTSCLIRKRTLNVNLMRSGTRKPRFPKIHVGLSQTQRLGNVRTVQIHVNVFFAHILKALCVFFSLCNHLFICLLIYFSLPQVQRACVWCAPMAVFTKGGRKAAAAAFRSKGGERDMSTYLRLHYKSLWLILRGEGKEKDIKKNLRWDQGYKCRAHCKYGLCQRVRVVVK